MEAEPALHLTPLLVILVTTSHLDTIAVFANFISVNNSGNRFIPDITIPCRPKWRPPLIIL